MSFVTSYAVFLLSAVFLVSGLAKIVDWNRFQNTLADLDIMPRQLILPFGIGLPSIEVILGVLLLVGERRSGLIAASLALTLLLVFSAVVLYAMRHDKGHLSCACFGQLSQGTFGQELIVRNAALLLVAAYVLTAALAGHDAQVLSRNDWLPALFLALSTFPVYTLASHFLSNRDYYTFPHGK